jgi:hypothetical protein
MRNTLGRLVLLMAEMLDRSLLTVPDVDLDEVYSPSARARCDRPTAVALSRDSTPPWQKTWPKSEFPNSTPPVCINGEKR